MRTFQEFLHICEELTGARKERATRIASQRTRTIEDGRKKMQANWLVGKSLIGKEHPSQGFGSHPDPKKSRAPKTAIANSRTSPGVKKRKLSSFAFNAAGGTNWKIGGENVPGHGMPQVDTLPRGKGSKAKRRAEALKKDA